jgi:hypothetical protein
MKFFDKSPLAPRMVLGALVYRCLRRVPYTNGTRRCKHRLLFIDRTKKILAKVELIFVE